MIFGVRIVLCSPLVDWFGRGFEGKSDRRKSEINDIDYIVSESACQTLSARELLSPDDRHTAHAATLDTFVYLAICSVEAFQIFQN